MLVLQLIILAQRLINVIFYKCGICENRITRLSSRAFFQSWSSNVGDNFAQGFKCARCGSRYILPWYATFMAGSALIFLVRSILTSSKHVSLGDLFFYFFIAVIVYIIYYSCSPLTAYYENKRWRGKS